MSDNAWTLEGAGTVDELLRAELDACRSEIRRLRGVVRVLRVELHCGRHFGSQDRCEACDRLCGDAEGAHP